MTRDELVADLARHLRHDVEVYDEADAARAVLDRLEALGWTERGYCPCLCHADRPDPVLPPSVTDNVPCPTCGGDRLRPDYTGSGHCHAGRPR